MMNNNMLSFTRNLSMGYLNVEKMRFERIDNVNTNHPVFKHIKPPFDWYFQDEILIIPDPVSSPRKNWNKIITLDNQKIECKGNFFCFFHFKQKDSINLVESLTLPEYTHIKKSLEIY